MAHVGKKNLKMEKELKQRFLQEGASQLSNTELISLILQKGRPLQPPIALAKQIMDYGNDNLLELGKLSFARLIKIEGIGSQKAMALLAAIELGRRRQLATPLEKLLVSKSEDIAVYLQHKLRDLPHEIFAVLFLNRANKVNQFEIVSQGGITGTIADPRIILKKALEYSAVSLILCHNHPSGSLKPSRADEEITYKIKQAARFLDIVVLDHIIVSESGYYSFADEGLL